MLNSMAELNKIFLTLAEAAEISSRSRNSLRRAIRCGELRASKFSKENSNGNGSYYIKPKDLEKYFAANVVHPSTASA
jgi:Helix-turn-helix domain